MIYSQYSHTQKTRLQREALLMVLLSVKGGTRGSIPTNTFDSISSRAVSLSELRSRLSKVTQSNRTWYFIIVTKSQFGSCTGSNKIQESGCNVRVVSTSPHFNTGHCTIHQPREAVQQFWTQRKRLNA